MNVSTPLTLIIIVFTVIASYSAWKSPSMFERWMFNPYKVKHRKEYYRFISSGFVHANTMHLFFNMFTFYFFGSLVETRYKYYFDNGVLYFLGLYLVGIVVSDLGTYYKHRNNIYYNSLGASGGVSAVVFSSIIFDPLNQICIWGVFCLPGFLLGALYLIYSYYAGRAGAGKINHDAHLYGALFGVGFSIAIRPEVIIEFLSNCARSNSAFCRFSL